MVKALVAVVLGLLCAGAEAGIYPLLPMPCQSDPGYYYIQTIPLLSATTTVTGMQLTLAPWGTGCSPQPGAWTVELCGSTCTDVTSYFQNTVYGTQTAGFNLFIDQSTMKLNFHPHNDNSVQAYCGITVTGTVLTSSEVNGTNVDQVVAAEGNRTVVAKEGAPLALEGTVLGAFSGLGQVQTMGSGSYVYWNFDTTSATPVAGMQLTLVSWGIGCAVNPNFGVKLCYNDNTDCIDFSTRFNQVYGTQYVAVNMNFPSGGLAVRVYNQNYVANWCGLNTSFALQ
eukprot:TRINITY_DN134_c0_g1_i3.p1 TRINITY_DN134_c0_g1~~TRINITY_DN134_c0_g1_i3.p1  ORF type:complete len:300 (+),score=113.01 TRINITY_DN134_c0_g1_i3:52-900(+)